MDARYGIAKILIYALLPLCAAPVLKAQSLIGRADGSAKPGSVQTKR